MANKRYTFLVKYTDLLGAPTEERTVTVLAQNHTLAWHTATYKALDYLPIDGMIDSVTLRTISI